MDVFGGTERFAVRRKLGAGAMGTVYHALDRETGSDVAIKVLTHVDPPHVQRFKNEFRRLADMQHPNLVQLGELFCEDGQWFFTMELVQGSDLMRFVRGPAYAWMASLDASVSLAAGELPFDDARLRAAMRQLAVGTSALHAAQIVHRDIKPSNVVASFDGRVVLLDFGLATPSISAEQSQSARVVGTVSYMAPEQAAGKPATPGADWYSVGVVLYEALTGKLPFTGNGLEIMIEKQRREPPPPREVVDCVPADLNDLCVALLRHEPEKRPAAREVLERLGVNLESVRTSTVSRSSLGSVSHELVGREAELDQLDELFTRGGDEARVIAIRGASGVGKSVLAREFCTRCEARGPDVLVLSSRCYERESLPYKAFDGIVEGLTRALSRRDQIDTAMLMPDDAALVARLFPSLRQVPAMARIPEPRLPNQQELRKRAFEAMRQLLVRLTKKHRLVLSIDDFQWADPDSLALVTELLRGPGAPALLLVTTIRDGLGLEPARSWTPPTDCQRLELVLQNLEPRTAELLARRMLASEDLRTDLDLGVLAREAQGHPLFLLELVRHAVTGGGAEASVTLDDALWARARQLDEPALRLLQILCVASRPLPQKAAFVAADLAPAEGRRWSSLLRVAHLARTGGVRDSDTIEPYHDRVRESVLAHLDRALITDLHTRIAAALESLTDARAERQVLVFHLAAAGQAERARALAVRAAEDAEQVLAFDRAAALYLQAVELGHPDASLLYTRRGEALAAAGRGAEAAEAFLAAARTAPDAANALENRRRAADQLLMSGHINEGMAALRTVLDAIGERLPATPLRTLLSLLYRRLLVRLRGMRFRLGDGSNVPAQQLSRVDIYASIAKGLAMVDTLRGADFQARHFLLAMRVGEPARVAQALALEAGYQSVSSRDERRSNAALRAAESLSSKTASPWAGPIIIGTWSLVHFERGRWQKAREASELAEQRMLDQCTAVVWEINTTRFFGMYSLFYLGELRELSARVPALLRDAEQRGDLYAATNLRGGLPNASWLVRGDVAGARAALDAVARGWSTEGFHVQHWHAVLAAENLRLYAGEHSDDGRLPVEQAWQSFVGAHFHRVELMRIEALHLRARSLLATALVDAGRRAALLRKARALGKSLAREKATYGVGFGQLVLSACAYQAGAFERAATLLGAGVSHLEHSDTHMYAAMARWSLALMLGGHERELGEKRAQRWADEQGVAEPARWRAMLLPGLP